MIKGWLTRSPRTPLLSIVTKAWVLIFTTRYRKTEYIAVAQGLLEDHDRFPGVYAPFELHPGDEIHARTELRAPVKILYAPVELLARAKLHSPVKLHTHQRLLGARASWVSFPFSGSPALCSGSWISSTFQVPSRSLHVYYKVRASEFEIGWCHRSWRLHQIGDKNNDIKPMDCFCARIRH